MPQKSREGWAPGDLRGGAEVLWWIRGRLGR